MARVNPLTYEVDGLRALMISGGTSTLGVGTDLAVLVGATAALVALAARLFPRLGQ